MSFNTSAIPALELSPLESSALNAVDIHLYFGSHAYPDATIEHGRMELAVDDRDFAGIEAVVGQLDPAKGDVFAREAESYGKQWDLHRYMNTLLNWELSASPYITPEDHNALLSADEQEMDTETKPNFIDKLNKLRALWLINPIDYGCVLADIKDVPVYYADAHESESKIWFKKADALMEISPTISRPVLAWKESKNYRAFRDTRAITKLASIAISMSVPGQARPILAYAGGGDHQKNIERLLDENDVVYTSHSFSPDRKNEYRRELLRDIGHILIPKFDSSNARHQKLWIANATNRSSDLT